MLGHWSVRFALAALISAVGCFAREPDPLPDVLLLTVDTLRADRLGAYGYTKARTPTLDALAARAVVFTQATTPMPRTTPGLASLMTGLVPRTHGSRDVGRPMRRGLSTLPMRMQAAGYATAGYSANANAAERQRFADGFDTFAARSLAPAEQVTDAVIGHAEQAPPAKPLFLWAHYVDPHMPYTSPLSSPQTRSACMGWREEFAERGLTEGHLFSDFDGSASARVEACSQAYDDEVAYADREIARLLAGINAARIGRDRWIVFASDHGENLGEDSLFFEHGPSVHDASLRVPLLVVGPGVQVAVIDQPVGLQDVVPTLLSLLGLAPVEAVEGVDLAAIVRGDGDVPERILRAEAAAGLRPEMTQLLRSGLAGQRQCLHEGPWSLCREPNGPFALVDNRLSPAEQADEKDRHPRIFERLKQSWAVWPAEEARQRTARKGPYKLVERPRVDGTFAAALYDVVLDPGETRDIQAEHAELVAELRAALKPWDSQRLPGAMARPEVELEQLRRLGYID